MLTRRNLLIGGGAGVGLVVLWAGWPRSYTPNLALGPGETPFGAYLKIGTDGQVTVAVPQTEHGQGAYTALAQIVADELGADWRTVGVEAAPINPLYANPLAARELWGELLPGRVADEVAEREALMLTAGSTSVRMFEALLREAGATARALLMKAAAARWSVDWRTCGTAAGFVTHAKGRLRFAELAAEAAGKTPPDPLPYRRGDANRLVGQSLPRLDAPAKVDGSANFAGDIRLPDMVFASVVAGPSPTSRLLGTDKAAADRVPGVLQVVETDSWAAAIGVTWWAANRGVEALAPRFATTGPAIDDAATDAALSAALKGDGERIAAVGDLDAAFAGGEVLPADYRVAPAVHAALETPAATAHWHAGRLELWIASDAPARARAVAAEAIGVAADAVIVHPQMVGGSFGEALESAVVAQAAVLAFDLKRPVQVTWSRREALRQDRVRAPVRARLTARLSPAGQVLGWLAGIAAPATGHALARRLGGDLPTRAALALAKGDASVVSGAVPPYRLPAYAIDHHPAEIGPATGWLRGGADGYTAFFTETFVDELARRAGTEPVSFRFGMLGGNPRLARCLSTAAALGGWGGGAEGSGQGIACHAMRGSFVAVLAEVHVDGDRIGVDRLVAAVDCGRVINPDLVKQQIEGGLVFGMAAALGASQSYADGKAVPGALRLPTLADTPDITVELIASDAEPGGAAELGVPAVAPAIGNAVRTLTGLPPRELPLRARA
jgi:isoquinoline 1-oxidoreductase beta subunit